jgi:hypothetical protein
MSQWCSNTWIGKTVDITLGSTGETLRGLVLAFSVDKGSLLLNPTNGTYFISHDGCSYILILLARSSDSNFRYVATFDIKSIEAVATSQQPLSPPPPPPKYVPRLPRARKRAREMSSSDFLQYNREPIFSPPDMEALRRTETVPSPITEVITVVGEKDSWQRCTSHCVPEKDALLNSESESESESQVIRIFS